MKTSTGRFSAVLQRAVGGGGGESIDCGGGGFGQGQ